MRECTNLRFPNLARTLVAGSGALVAESAVGLELALLLGDTRSGEHGALNACDPALKKFGLAVVRMEVASSNSKLLLVRVSKVHTID